MPRPTITVSNPKDAGSHGFAPVVGNSFVRLWAASFGPVTVVVDGASVVVVGGVSVVVVPLESGAATAVHCA